MRTRRALIAALLLLPGCRGSVPPRHGRPEQGISAVLIGGRIVLPTGETPYGSMAINLDGEGGREAEVYRLPVRPQQTVLFQVEPGTYRLSPTRSLFGAHQARLKVVINGRAYSAPFPREILRKPSLLIRPTKIVSLGVLEAELVTPRLPGRAPVVRVRLDDAVETRRRLVEKTIREMMDPTASGEMRESAVAWTRALETCLSELQAEFNRAPTFKRAP